MGYYHDKNVAVEETDTRHGIHSYLYDRQFTPSSTALPALGTSYDQFGRPISPTSYGGIARSPWTIGVAAPVSKPAPTPAPTPAPVPTPYSPPSSPTPGSGGVIGISSGNPVATAPYSPPLTIVSPSAPATPANQQAAANNSDTLTQQAAVATAQGNPVLAKALTDQAISWNDISAAIKNAIPTSMGGGSLLPVSSDFVSSSSTTPPIKTTTSKTKITPAKIVIIGLVGMLGLSLFKGK